MGFFTWLKKETGIDLTTENFDKSIYEPVIEKPTQFIGKNIIEPVYETVVEKPAKFINDEIIQPVVKTVKNTVDAILKDPLPFIAQVAGSFVGIPPYVTSAAITAMRGGDITDIAKSAAVAYIGSKAFSSTTYGQSIGNASASVGDFTSNLAQQYGLSATTANVLGSAAQSGINSAALGGIRAVLTGKDVGSSIVSGFTQGAIYSGSDSYFSDINTQKDWGVSPDVAKQLSNITSSGLNALVSGKDPAAAIGNYITYAALKTAESEIKQGVTLLWNQASKFAEETIKVKTTYDAKQSEYDKAVSNYQAKVDEYNANRNKINSARDPYISAYQSNLSEYNKQKTIYDDTSRGVVERNLAADKMNAYADEMQKAIDGANSFNSQLEDLNKQALELDLNKQSLTDPNFGIAKELKASADAVQTNYDNYNKTIADAKASDDRYGVQLAEVATREALVDSVNNGLIKTVDNPNAPEGSITLENGLVITPDGKYLQDGKEVFANAHDIEQSKIDFKSDDGSRYIFNNSGQRLTSETDAVKIAASEFGIKLDEKEAEKFVGVPYGTLDPLKTAAEAKVEEQLKDYGYKAPSKEVVGSFIQKGGDTLGFVEQFIDPYHVAADEVNEYYKAVLGREATPEEIELHAGAKAEADVFNERQAQELERMRILQEVFGQYDKPIYAETSKGLDVPVPRGYRIASIDDVNNKDKTGAIFDPGVNAWLVTESKPLTDKQYDFLRSSVAGGDDATTLGLLNAGDGETRVEVGGRFKLAGDAGIDYSKIPAGYRPATPEEAEARTATDDKGIFGDIHSNTLLIPDGSVPTELLQDYTAGYYSRSEDPSLDQIVIKDTREPAESDIDFLLRQFYGDYYKQSKPTKSLPTVYVNANREYEYTPWEEDFPVEELPSLDPVTVTAKREEEPLLDLPYSPLESRPPVTNVVLPSSPAIKFPDIKSPATKKPTSDALIYAMMNTPVETAQQEESELPVVKQSRFFDMRQPLDIAFFNQPTGTTTTQEQPGVVKIASGGYMDILFPKQGMSMDEILRILEGK